MDCAWPRFCIYRQASLHCSQGPPLPQGPPKNPGTSSCSSASAGAPASQTGAPLRAGLCNLTSGLCHCACRSTSTAAGYISLVAAQHLSIFDQNLLLLCSCRHAPSENSLSARQLLSPASHLHLCNCRYTSAAARCPLVSAGSSWSTFWWRCWSGGLPGTRSVQAASPVCWQQL